jgi:uncharacterized protein
MENTPELNSNRRTFLRRAAGTVGISLIPISLSGLVSACTDSSLVGTDEAMGDEMLHRVGRGKGGYGPLVNDNGVVAVPEGFQVKTFGAIGDPMSDGNVTPIAHDGMAAFPYGSGNNNRLSFDDDDDGHGRGRDDDDDDDRGADRRGRVRLLRNHEARNPAAPGAAIGDNPYDSRAGGGVVTLEVSSNRELIRDFVSLSGTWVNCAGGPTPWGSWLTCEETVVGPNEGFEKQHGYVFEVPSWANSPVQPVPLKAMGRFSHEAIAIDPSTGIVYLTEDNGFTAGNPDRPGSGFYRFIPRNRSGRYGSLQAGGRLQMARVKRQPKAQLFMGGSVGDTYDIEWVDINNPDPFPTDAGTTNGQRMTAVFYQGWNKGAAAFSRLEGCWYGEGSIFFDDTAGGAAGVGQVWQYVPRRNKLVLVFESPGVHVLDSPDNITVSPRGGVILCEDGGGEQFVRGLTPRGEIFDLMRNSMSDSEFAGACFSPDGETLYVNIQGTTSGTPQTGAGKGMTIAMWGPWQKGAV